MEATSQCPFPECLRPFSNCYNLKKHINSHHLKLKPFKCSFCSKAFGYKHSMLHHQLSHEQAERAKYTGEVLVPDLCRLLKLSKDPDLCPYTKSTYVGRKRRRHTEEAIALLPRISGPRVEGLKLPRLEDAELEEWRG